MAQDYILLNDRAENGMIAINKSVFYAISEISTNEIENAELAPSTFSKPISIRIDNNELKINVDMKVRYGANVNSTCELVQNKIYENVLFMTGYRPNDVTINVVGFDF